MSQNATHARRTRTARRAGSVSATALGLALVMTGTASASSCESSRQVVAEAADIQAQALAAVNAEKAKRTTLDATHQAARRGAQGVAAFHRHLVSAAEANALATRLRCRRDQDATCEAAKAAQQDLQAAYATNTAALEAARLVVQAAGAEYRASVLQVGLLLDAARDAGMRYTAARAEWDDCRFPA